MKNKKLLTNILFAVVVLAIAAVLLAVRSHNATGGKLTAQLIYGDSERRAGHSAGKGRDLQCGHRLLYGAYRGKGRQSAVY